MLFRSVLYCEQEGKRLFYLVRNRAGHIGFPKGHTEPGESETATALREIQEETGRQATLDDRFRTVLSYTLPDGRKKEAVYFLARFEGGEPARPSAEIAEVWLVEAEDACLMVTYDQERRLLTAALAFLLGLG